MENNYKEVSSMRAPRLLLRLMGKAIALLALFVVFAAGTANAQTVCYVDTGGDDNLDGQTPATANRTIAGCLAEGYVADGTIISVEAGTYNEAHVTIGEDLIFEGRQTGSFTRAIVENGFTVDADVTIRANTLGGGDAVFRLGDTNLTNALVLDDGSLTVANSAPDGRVRIAAGGRVTRDDDTSVTGEITYLGAAQVFYTDNNGSDTNVTAGGEFPSDFNDGTLNVNILGGNTLTFATVTDLDVLTVASGSALNGNVVIDENITITGPGNAGTLTVNDGTVTIASNLAVQSVNIANNDDVIFALGANTLTLNGDFVRLGGTFTSGAGARFDFVGASSSNQFSPGPNFAISTVTINKSGQTLEITEDIDVTNTGGLAFMVASASTVSFADDQINVTSSGVVDIDGVVVDESLIVFRAAGANMQGDGLYGDILVATGGGDVTVGAGTQEDVRWTGELNLTSGGITVGGDDDISPSGTDASIVVNAARADTDIAGTFNADNVDYNLQYTGNIGGGTKVAGSEFEANDIRNLVFDTQNGVIDAVTNGTSGTISGNVSLNDVGTAYQVNIPTPITIVGNLAIGDDATLNGTALILQGSSNSVLGTISPATTTTLDGTLTLSGSGSNDFPAEVGPIVVNNGEVVTITDIQRIVGALTVNTDGVLTLGLAREQAVTGNITSNGTSVTLASDVDAGGNVAINSGTLAFGGNDLMVTGNFTGAVDVTYTASGGALDLGTANKTLSVNGETIPNVIVSGVTATMSSNAVIGNSLIETGAGVLDVNGNTLDITGTVTSNGGTFIDDAAAAPGGLVTFVSTTLTLSGDATIDARILVDNNTLTVATNNANNPRTLTAGRAVELEGNLILGINSFVLGGNNTLTFDGGIVTSSSGELVLADANVDFANNNDGTVDMLAVTTATAFIGPASDGDLTINDQLRLDASIVENDQDDNLILADEALIIVNAANPLAGADPTFQGTVSITYNVATNPTGVEVPDNGGLLDLTINQAVNFDQDATVDGTLTIGAALTTASNGDIITLADGATLKLQADNSNVPANKLSATNYTLEYEGPSDTISDIEFLSGATVTTLVIDPGTGDTITNSLTGGGNVRTVNNVLLDSGILQLAGIGLNVAGDLTFDGATLINGTAGTEDANVALRFTGADSARVNLNGSYVVDDINWTLDKSSDAIVTLTGPAGAVLDFRTAAETLFLNGGIFATEDDVAIFLFQDATTQGFERNVTGTEESHISGNVRKRLLQGDPFGTKSVDFNNDGDTSDPGETGVARSARFEFPTGPEVATGTADYRPYSLTFREQVVTQTDLTVNHQGQDPAGIRGLPIASGDVLIGNYPDYFWLVSASTSLGQAQSFDVELTATDIGIPFTDEDDLRIIRRFDGDATTNEWSVQGDAGNYSNFVQTTADGPDPGTEPDTTAVVRVLNSTGGLVPQGARFTLGLPTRPPTFTSAHPDTVEVTEGEGETVQFAADAQDLGETIRFGLDGAPDFASIDTDTGLLSLEPEFDDAGTYNFDVLAIDGRIVDGTFVPSDTTRAALTVVVLDALSITPAPSDTTLTDNETLTIDFDVSDVDPGSTITFGIEETVANAEIDASTGVFTFAPSFDQSDSTFTFTVFATNGTDTASVSFDVTVETVVLYGDANLSGDVTPLDASVVLQHAAGSITLTGKAFTQADVSGTAGVTAFDAALILQFLTPDGDGTILDCFPADPDCEAAAKTGLVAFGDPQWGEVSVDAQTNTITLPIALDGNVDNVFAVSFSADIDAELVTFKQVTGMLPDDWMVKHSFDKESGKLTVAMAGATPLSDAGVIAKATFEQLDKDSKPVFRARGFVNENASVEFAEIKAEQLPTEFALGNNYPNPFNPSTSIAYALPEKAQVTLEIYDVAGRLVQTLVNQEKEAGRYTIQWDGQNAAGSQVASGLYVYRIKAGSFVEAKTMMLVK